MGYRPDYQLTRETQYKPGRNTEICADDYKIKKRQELDEERLGPERETRKNINAVGKRTRTVGFRTG